MNNIDLSLFEAELRFFCSLRESGRVPSFDYLAPKLTAFLRLLSDERNTFFENIIYQAHFDDTFDFVGECEGYSSFLDFAISKKVRISRKIRKTDTRARDEIEGRNILIWAGTLGLFLQDWNLSSAAELVMQGRYLSECLQNRRIASVVFPVIVKLIDRAVTIERRDLIADIVNYLMANSIKIGGSGVRIGNILNGKTSRYRINTDRKRMNIEALKNGLNVSRQAKSSMFIPHSAESVDFDFAQLADEPFVTSRPLYPDLIPYFRDSDELPLEVSSWDYHEAFYGDKRLDRVIRSYHRRESTLLRAIADEEISVEYGIKELVWAADRSLVSKELGKYLQQLQPDGFQTLRERLSGYFSERRFGDLLRAIMYSGDEWDAELIQRRTENEAFAEFSRQLEVKTGGRWFLLDASDEKKAVGLSMMIDESLAFAPEVPRLAASFQLWSLALKLSVSLRRLGRLEEAIRRLEQCALLPEEFWRGCPSSERKIFYSRLVSYKLILGKKRSADD